MIPFADQGIRFLVSQMKPSVWVKGTRWASIDEISTAINRGYVQSRGSDDDREISLTDYGMEQALRMGPDGTMGKNER